MDREIQGFYYDKQRKKYFRIGTGSGGQNQLTKDHLKDSMAKESLKSFRRLDPTIHLPQTLHKQEINFQTKYNLREEVIRSQLKPLKGYKTNLLEVIDFMGNDMKNISVDSLIASPKSDQLFAVLTGDTGAVIYQISVKDIFSEEFNVNQSKRVINSFPKPNRVNDISYTFGSNNHFLSTVVHHFPNPTTIRTSISLTKINGLSETRNMRKVFEFEEPILCSTHFNDLYILGAERKVIAFCPSHSGKISIIPFKDKITALKTSSEAKYFICGSNKGQLTCIDIRENYKFEPRLSFSLHDRNVVFLDILNDDNTVISSAHNHYISLSDLRMFNKPIFHLPNHSNHCSKIPFSVEESIDVLCSTGDDNLVRFWSIKSAKLLHMYSRVDSHNSNSLPSLQPLSHVWFSNSWKCLNNRPKPLLFSMSSNRLDVISHPNL